MTWEGPLDRLLLRQIHLAEEGELRDSEISALLDEAAAELGQRERTWFHLGYGRSLLGLDLPAPPVGCCGGADRWFRFGRLRGNLRRNGSAWLDDLSEDEEELLDLLVEPAIAAQVLPALMAAYFKNGDFERAALVLELMETGEGEETTLLVDAALTDLVSRVERGNIAAEEEGSLRRALRRTMQLVCFEALPAREKARFDRVLGESYLATGEWDEASTHLERALELAGDDPRLLRSLRHLLALAKLHVFDIGELQPENERDARDAAFVLLDAACEPGCPLPEALYARGILRYEQSDFASAAADFAAATKALRAEPTTNEALLQQTRFFEGASLLADGCKEEGRKAARLLAETLPDVRPDLASFYYVHDELKAIDQKVALLFLDSLDLERGSSAESLLLVALEYQSLGEPGRALRAADRVLQVATDLDQRIEALKVQLTASNMQGDADAARDAYCSMRDLLLRRGKFDDLERILEDEALVGQALDHLEVKAELADLYEEMEGKEWERASLQIAMARTMKAKKDLEHLEQALALLREVGIAYPELAQEDIENLEKLLALRRADEPSTRLGEEKALVATVAKVIGRAPRVLVVGGNERQRKHHPKLSALADAWGFEAEWLMTSYTSPQKVVAQIRSRLADGLELLVLLHWNRHETTEPALAAAREAGVRARTLFYAGFSSLQVCLREMLPRLAPAAV